MIRDILAAMDIADHDDGVGAVIVTGAVRAFCSVADLTRGEDTIVHVGTAEMAGETWRRKEARKCRSAFVTGAL
jgi:enoyl-CoA hydratase/carnithine racemase